MTYLIWTTLAIAHLVGMAIAHGTERRRTCKPDPFFYALWELWLCMWVVAQVLIALRDALRWTFMALDDIGYRIGR
jgi:hypothetical protein